MLLAQQVRELPSKQSVTGSIPVQRTKYHHFAGYAAVFARRYSTVIPGRKKPLTRRGGQ